MGAMNTIKRDYWPDIHRPWVYKITPFIIFGSMFIFGMVSKVKKESNLNPSVDEPRQMLTRGQFEDLTPHPSWSIPLYDDSGLTPEDAFLMSPARSMAARDSPLPVHAHMSRYDVTYDAQQQDLINTNLRQQFGRWRS